MFLVPLTGGPPVHLAKAVMLFGRGNECDVVLKTSRKVSRKHCCIAQIDDSYLIRDLGSMNGVRVNQLLADPELPIAVGDELWIGDIGFRFVSSVARSVAPEPTQTRVDETCDADVIEDNIQEAAAGAQGSHDFLIKGTSSHLLIQSDEIEFNEDEN